MKEDIEGVPGVQCLDPETGHIYFLLLGDVIVYIGSSMYVRSRIASHRLDADKVFDRAYIYEVSKNERLALEAALIALYWPEFNRRSGRRMEMGQMRRLLKRHGFSTDGLEESIERQSRERIHHVPQVSTSPLYGSPSPDSLPDRVTDLLPYGLE